MENEVQKKRILSGIQPSGDLTLGSYLGAIKNWAALADQYDCYYMLADMHTITVRQTPADLRRLCPSAKTGEGLAIRGSRVDGARQQVESWLRKAGLLPA